MSTSQSGSKPSGGWLPPSLQDMQDMLPQYHFERLLGRGGMGAVYKAVQTSLDRAVAIKVLPSDLLGDDDAQFADRFKNEARTMAKMSHPSIVNVFDFGETQSGLLYFVMEFIDGTDVAQMITVQGKLPEDHALSITAHVCDALAYAHARGVIHRDIKPANILINMEGAVKVADFGLAKQNDAGQSALTKTNMTMGTPDFVAPEALIPGVPLDGRVDLYAIGVMLYQMLTGDIPRGMWKMPGARAGTDPRFDAIIAKAMQTDREERYQSAGDIRRDLDTILTLPRSVLIQRQQEAAEAAAKATRAQKAAVIHAPQAKAAEARPPAAKGGKKSRGGLWAGLGSTVAALAAGSAFIWSTGDKTAQKPSPTPAAKSAQKALPKPPPSKAPRSEVTGPAATSPNVPEAVMAPAPVLTNSLGMPFMAVPGTRILLAAHETRRQDYAAYAASVSGVDPTWKSPRAFSQNLPTGDDHPVSMVSWKDAQVFCQWLGKREGRAYRLPTEHEWHLAVAQDVREPDTISEKELLQIISTQYPWGSLKPEQAGNYRGTEDGHASTAPVGSLQPNRLGLHDLGGNVWEWCTTSKDEPVILGCGYQNYGPFRKSGTRKLMAADFRVPDSKDSERPVVGFRLAIDTTLPPPGRTTTASPPVPMHAPAPAAKAETPPPAATDPVSTRLASLERTFLEAFEKQIGAAHKAALADLNAKFTAALDRSMAAASQAGKLDEALTLRNEKTLIQNAGAVPEADDAETPDALKALRKTWRGQMAVLIAKRDQSAAPLHASYDRALATYQDELTKAQKLDEAIRVKAVRDHIASQRESGASPAPEIATPATARPSATHSGNGRAAAPIAPPLQADKVLPPPPPATQEEIRSLCEWALNKDGRVALMVGGKRTEFVKGEPLPRGKLTVVDFFVYELSFEEAANEKRWFEIIGRLPDLESIYFNKNPGTMPVEMLRGATKLKALRLAPTSVDDAAFAHLTVLKNLESVDITYMVKRFTGMGLGYINENLEFLGTNSPSLTAEGLAYLARFKKLKRLNLTGDSLGGRDSLVTDAMLTGLASLTELEALNVTELKLDGSFLTYLPANSKLKRLELFDIKTFKPEHFKHLTKLKHLEYLGLPPSDPGVEGLTIISGLGALKELVLSGPGFTGESFKGMKGFRSLERLWITACPLNDAGMDAIATALPSLKSLEFSNEENFKVTLTAEGFSSALDHFRSLTNLQINGRRTTDAWLPAIARQKLVNYIMLTYAQITDQGLVPLMKLPLGYLRLDGTPVTDAVIPVLKTCPTLNNVPVGGTQMTDAGKAELKKMLESR